MFRFRSNCRVMLVDPRRLVEVISVTPAMRPKWRSRGVATAEAIVSGLAPGSPAETETVGNSTSGNGPTGRKLYAIAPASNTAAVNSEVATGLLMKGAEIFTVGSPQSAPRRFLRDGFANPIVGETASETIEPQVNNRRGKQSQDLTDQQAADNADAQWPAQLRTGTGPERQRQAA